MSPNSAEHRTVSDAVLLGKTASEAVQAAGLDSAAATAPISTAPSTLLAAPAPAAQGAVSSNPVSPFGSGVYGQRLQYPQSPSSTKAGFLSAHRHRQSLLCCVHLVVVVIQQAVSP